LVNFATDTQSINMFFNADMDTIVLYGAAFFAALLLLSSLRSRKDDEATSGSPRGMGKLSVLAMVALVGAGAYYYFDQANAPPPPMMSYYTPRLMTSYKPARMCRYQVQ
jgi:hypothetical protein